MTKDDQLEHLDETLMQLDHKVGVLTGWSVAIFVLLLFEFFILVMIWMFQT